MPQSARRSALSAVVLTLALGACGTDLTNPPAGGATAADGQAALRGSMVAVGKAIFHDRNLSLNRNQACVSCHAPAWGFSAPDSRINGNGAVMPGSVGERFGNRRPPSAAYATLSPIISYNAEDGTYVGGNFWDGRATGERLGIPAAEQALAPFVNPVEQALPDPACAVFRAARGKYRLLYRTAFGNAVDQIAFPPNTDGRCSIEGSTIALSDADRVLMLREYDKMGRAIASFEHSPEVNQFSSKYDAVLAGQASFTPLEASGFAMFNTRGNCSACHPSDGAQALFTDFTYDNIGVPANPKNPKTRTNPLYRDLGVGGFFNQPGEWGKMKVPTLRNLDKRGQPGLAKSFMHNGAFKSLEEVVHFYNTRDVLPACETTSSPVSGVNCWPAPEVIENVNIDELGNLGLTESQEQAIVAFLKTLNDGYVVGTP